MITYHFLPCSTKYKDVVEGLDIVQNIYSKSDSFILSLDDLEDHINRPVVSSTSHVDGAASKSQKEERNSKVFGRKMKRVLQSLSTIYESLALHDFTKATFVYLESKRSLDDIMKCQVVIPSVNTSILLDEVSQSLSRSREWIDFMVNENVLTLSKVDNSSLEESVTCLSSLVVVNNLSFGDALNHIFATVSSSVDKSLLSSNLTTMLVDFFRSVYFVLRVVDKVFLQEGQLSLSTVVLQQYKITLPCTLNPTDIKKRTKEWFFEQKQKLTGKLPNVIRSTNNLTSIFDALSELTLVDLKLWNHLCSHVIETSINPWESYLRDVFKPHIESVISTKAEQAINHLTTTKHQELTNVSVSHFLWSSINDESTSDIASASSSLKKHAMVPGIEAMLDEFSRSISELRDETSPLLSPGKMSIVFEQDIASLKTFTLAQVSTKLEKYLSKVNQIVSQYPSKLLSIAFLTRSLAVNCPSLVVLYHLDATGQEYLKIHDLLIKTWTKWMSLFYHRRIENFSAQLLKISEVSIDQITDSLSIRWGEVNLPNKSDSPTTPVTTIKVPSYPSVPLMEFISTISREVNKCSGHGLSAELSTEISLKATIEVVRCYRETQERLKGSGNLLPAIQQKKAVQCYFDLHFWRTLVKGIRDPRIQTEQLPNLNSLAKSFEHLLDPFDFHLMSSSLNKSVLKAIKGTQHTLSFFIPDSALELIKKKLASEGGPESSHDQWRGRVASSPLPLLK